MTSEKRPSRTGARAAREREMLRLVREQERGGLSQRKFCEIHGMALSTLARWRRKLGRGMAGRSGPPADVGFLEVQLVDDAPVAEPASTGASPIEISLPGGAVIRIPRDAPEATLRHVIGMVGARC